MKIIYNNVIPFKGFKAINIFGMMFVRKGKTINAYDLNHESIHTEQMKELAFIFYYPLYFIEWLVKLFVHKFKNHDAYRNISFEKEAYENEKDLEYLKARKRYNWFKRIWK